VVLPLVLWAYDALILGKRGVRENILDKVPFLAVAGVFSFIALVAQGPSGGGGGWIRPLLSIKSNVLTMIPIFARYLVMLAYPTGLSPQYEPGIKTSVDGTVLVSTLLLALIAGVAFLLHRRRPDLLFWILVFFIGLIPVSQIVPMVTLINDRYLYFPIIGVAGLVGIGVVSAGDYAAGKFRRFIYAASLIGIASLATATYRQIDMWHDSITLWSRALEINQYSPFCRYMLTDALYKTALHRQADEGDLDAALPLYLKVLQLDPHHRDTLNNIAVLYVRKKELKKAREYLLRLTTDFPDDFEGLVNLGLAYRDSGDMHNARNCLNKALALQPQSVKAAEILKNLGSIEGL